VVPAVTRNATHTFLRFTYSHSAKTVEIIGTDVIPEFPLFLIPPLFMIAPILAVVLYRKAFIHFATRET